jgi:hypothetical protein
MADVSLHTALPATIVPTTVISERKGRERERERERGEG